ncbi:MAG: hypothetical protein ACREKM_09325, partial [Longimicrobiales bacterium]
MPTALDPASWLRRSPADCALLIVFCLATPVAPLDAALAQTPPSPDPEYVYEFQTRERWMHDGQRARFTPHHTVTDWLSVDSVRTTAPAERTMFVSR